MRDKRSIYSILVGKYIGKKPFETHRHRLNDITTGFKELVWEV